MATETSEPPDTSVPDRRPSTTRRLEHIAEILALDVSFFLLPNVQRFDAAPDWETIKSFVASPEGAQFVAFLMRINDTELRQRAVEMILSASSHRALVQ